MASRPFFQRSIASLTALVSLAALAWSAFVDLQTGFGEAVRVALGLAALWAPVGGVVYLCLRGRVSDPLARAVLAGAAAYAFTTPLYGLFAVGALWLPGCDRLFYVAQAALVAGSLGYALRSWSKAQAAVAFAGETGSPGDAASVWRRLARWGAAIGAGCRRLDATLLLLIALSLLATPRYKQPFEILPDGSHRLNTHGDVTYLTAQSYELARRTPAAQQSIRAGIKERAYHMYPHLTAMLVARYTGQDDMLRALMHYEFSVVEVFLCLLIFCIVRGVTGSRWAGYAAVAVAFVLAIPVTPLLPNGLGYFYFTWHTHASSNFEAAIICSPQMYCALPVVFGLMLCVLQISINLAHGRPLGALALLAAIMAGVMLRFRVQTFLLILPNVLLLLTIAWRRTGDRRLLGAGLAGVAVAAAQVVEMHLTLYYPETCKLVIRTTNIMHTVPYLNVWPGSEALRHWLEAHASPGVFKHAWQVACAAMFAMLNMIGLPVLFPALACVARPATWRSESWAYVGLVLWLTVGSVIGATCVATTYDFYSVGGQMLLMTGWYVLPVGVIGLWQIGHRLADRLPGVRAIAPVVGLAIVVAACGWQRMRGAGELQCKLVNDTTTLSPAEWDAMQAMHDGLPQDAVVLSKNDHHHRFGCMFSGVVGRRAYLEYMIDGHFTGPPDEKNVARLTRIEQVWQAKSTDDFAAAVLETGATHLVEYGRWPLGVHPNECLQRFWASPDGAVTVWKFSPPPGVAQRANIASRRAGPRSPFHAL
jgi:hypothetical protein